MEAITIEVPQVRASISERRAAVKRQMRRPTVFESSSSLRTLARWVNGWGPFAPAAMAALVAAQIVVAVLPGEPVELAAVGKIPSIATSTLAAGLASEGQWGAAATAALTLASVAVGAAVYRRMADGKPADRLPD